MARLAIDVIQELLDQMTRLVTDYPEGLQMTGRAITDLIAGTACFPGGSGLWRGNQLGGPLPEYFPEHPVMFVGHNFDKCCRMPASASTGMGGPFDFLDQSERLLEECGTA
jgi:hypothetical protein